MPIVLPAQKKTEPFDGPRFLRWHCCHRYHLAVTTTSQWYLYHTPRRQPRQRHFYDSYPHTLSLGEKLCITETEAPLGASVHARRRADLALAV